MANPPPPVGYVAPAHMAEEPVSCFQNKIDTEPLDDASIAPNVTVGGSLAGLSLDSSPASLLAKSAFLPSATPTTSIAPEPQTNHEESPHHSVLVDDANLNATSDGLMGDFRLQLSDGEKETPPNTSSASNTSEDDYILKIVPCWGRDDISGEDSTCPVLGYSVQDSDDIATVAVLVVSQFEVLREKYKSDGNARWHLRSIHILEHVIVATSTEHPLLPLWLFLQALTCTDLFVESRDVSLLDKAIERYRRALPRLPRNATYLQEFPGWMGRAFKMRYDVKGSLEDLKQSIEAYKQALELWPREAGPPIELTRDLGEALVECCVAGDVSDLGMAIRHLKESLARLDDDDPLRPVALNDLGRAYITQCERLGNNADVENAIQYLKQALSLENDNSLQRADTLNYLGVAFHTWHDISGRPSLLDDAIHYFQDGLSLRSHGDPNCPPNISNLGNALVSRYERTRDVSDLNQAITYMEIAISLLYPHDPGRPIYLHNLALMFESRGLTTSNVSDLDKAINTYHEALSLEHSHHPRRPRVLNALGGALIRRFELSKNEPDQKQGMGYFEEALSLYPSDHPGRWIPLLNLVKVPQLLSLEGFWDPALVLDRSTQLVKLIPPHHPHYSNLMTFVARNIPTFLESGLKIEIPQLFLLVGVDAGSDPLDARLAILDRASKASTSRSIDRLGATCDWIELCQDVGRPGTLEMYSRMFDLLDTVIARSCSLQTRRKQLSADEPIRRAKHLVSSAVAFAIEQGTIETAVEFLERGQSVLLAQLSRYRPSPLVDALHSVKPDLAVRFEYLSWQVESATFTEGRSLPGMGPKRPLEDPISRANRLKDEWNHLIQEIRAEKGFERFLLPNTYCTLRDAAVDGPIILVNINKSHSDAIIITSHRPPISVVLEYATPNQVEQVLVRPFRDVAKSTVDKKAINALKSLWDLIVEPIVDTLQDTLELPQHSRIWWCPTNPLMSLPLHAAGHYPRTKECLPSLYVSSYTSSLTALIRARQGGLRYSGLPSVVLVGQPNTPGQKELPNVSEEIQRIKQRIPHSTVIMDDYATHDMVLSAVTQHQWVHLSCHGIINRDDPLQSHFALHDGPLSLLELMRQRLPYAELAFLSACYSAADYSKAPDEFLHLAAGMQFAGFKSVVGTMWPMSDMAGPPLVDEFYRRMIPEDTNASPDHKNAARALRKAIQVLRKTKLPSVEGKLENPPFSVWINFVHWGA